MKITSIIKYLVLCVPLTAQAALIAPLGSTWNIDDPSGRYIGSFVYEGVGGYSDIYINGTTGDATEEWNSIASGSDLSFNSGPGLYFGAFLDLVFEQSLEAAMTPVVTNFILTVFGEEFSRGSFEITTEIPPEHERPQPSPVPAPATFALFALGLAGLGWSKRKKA